MKLKIDASDLVTRHYLEVSDRGIEYCQTSAFGGVRRFRFDQVDAVLRGQGKLSFQIGRETFKIPIRLENGMHRATMARLVSEVRRTLRRNAE